jgi:hypothetical protein
VYWNLKKETCYLLLLSAFYLIMAVEAFKQYAQALLNRELINIIMAIATAFTVYPNIYSFWATFNYINDNLGYLWYTQLFFSVTEMINSYCCFQLSRHSKDVPKNVIAFLNWVTIAISVVHIIQSGIDQTIINLISGERHQLARDIAFTVCDFGVLICSSIHVRGLYQKEGIHPQVRRQHAFNALKFAVFIWILFQFIP